MCETLLKTDECNSSLHIRRIHITQRGVTAIQYNDVYVKYHGKIAPIAEVHVVKVFVKVKKKGKDIVQHKK